MQPAILTYKATQDFSSLPSLVEVPSEHKRLSVMFSGYLYQHEPPLGAYAIMTNFHDFALQKEDSKAWDSFKCTYWNEKRPRKNNFTFIQRIGAWPAMSTAEVNDGTGWQEWHNSGVISTPSYHYSDQETGVACGKTFNARVTATNSIGQTVTSTETFTTVSP